MTINDVELRLRNADLALEYARQQTAKVLCVDVVDSNYNWKRELDKATDRERRAVAERAASLRLQSIIQAGRELAIMNEELS